MKAIICEMCNGQEMVKQDGYFVCQSCGTRYSVEEAKKMMVEVEGAVKIDNSDFVERYLQNARRAKAKEDWLEVEKYYNMVEQNDPTNIEAIFYSAFGKAKWSLTDNDIYKRQAIFKSLRNSISILDDNYDVAKENELKPILGAIVTDIIHMFGSEFVFTQTRNGYGNIVSDNKAETYSLFIQLASEMITTLTNIFLKIPESARCNSVYIIKLRQQIAEYLGKCQFLVQRGRIGWLERCIVFAIEIRKYDTSYVMPNYRGMIEADQARNGTSSGILIARCVLIALAAIGVVVLLIALTI